MRRDNFLGMHNPLGLYTVGDHRPAAPEPPPDTRRLDWLERHKCDFVDFSEDRGNMTGFGLRVDDGWVYHLGDTKRAAIDVAMRAEGQS